MSKITESLTSVSIHNETFNDFKRNIVGSTSNLKKLVEFAMKLYLVDENFKERVDNHVPGRNVNAEIR